VHEASGNKLSLPVSGDPSVTVASLDLPAGNYLLAANVFAIATPSPSAPGWATFDPLQLPDSLRGLPAPLS